MGQGADPLERLDELERDREELWSVVRHLTHQQALPPRARTELPVRRRRLSSAAADGLRRVAPAGVVVLLIELLLRLVELFR